MIDESVWAPLDALEKLVGLAVRKALGPDDAEWLVLELRAIFRAAKGMRAETCSCAGNRAAVVVRQFVGARQERVPMRGRRPRRRTA